MRYSFAVEYLHILVRHELEEKFSVYYQWSVFDSEDTFTAEFWCQRGRHYQQGCELIKTRLIELFLGLEILSEAVSIDMKGKSRTQKLTCRLAEDYVNQIKAMAEA